MRPSRILPKVPARRRGAVGMTAIALLGVVLAVLAVLLDWTFVNMVHTELSRAADAAALAAARALLNEDQLRGEIDRAAIREAARAAAGRFAGMNLTAGEPTELSTGDDAADLQDVFVGQLERFPGVADEFVEDTTEMLDTVRVIARRTRDRGNPLGMLLGRVFGVTTAEVVARAQATLDDRIVGFEPVCDTRVPLMPLAILASDPTRRRHDTWEGSITNRCGCDEFGFDPETDSVVRGSDGISELELTVTAGVDEAVQANVAVLDIGNGLDANWIARQIRSGIGRDELEPLGGSLLLPGDGRLVLRGSFEIPSSLSEALREQIGKCRVWPLYAAASASGAGPARNADVTVVGFVGARVLDVVVNECGCLVVRVQPCFVVTRTAVARPTDRSVPRNLYIRKLSITG